LAGFIVVCSRDRSSARFSPEDLKRCALRLTPDNVHPNPPDVLVEAGLLRAVVNPVPSVRIDRHGVCLGALFETADWSTPLTAAPDGSFAICRHDERNLELVADNYASRDIWYAFTDDLFLASTSQRAIVSLLGSFEPCEEAVSWMVASGYLGPEVGWDSRLRRMPGRTCLRLDREAWSLSTTTHPIEYRPVARPVDEHIALLREGVFSVCRALDLSGFSWALMLSGGRDSRALLVGLLRAGKTPRCITWGLASSLDDPKSDAFVARQLAGHMGVEHEYFALDYTSEAEHDVLTRFLVAGEGRAEDFSGYTDGLKTWQRLFTSSMSAVVRGDPPAWGSYPPINDFVTRSMIMNATLVSDYPEGHLMHRLELAPQHLPAAMYRQPDESLDFYRDRIYTAYKVTTFHAALNQPKCAYVEVVNPQFGRSVVEVASQLPDELRHCRRGYERMVGGLVPEIPFAEHHADARAEVYVSRRGMVQEMLAELSSQRARHVLSTGALDLLVSELTRPPGVNAEARLRTRVKAVLPSKVVRWIRPSPRWHLDARRVAFRAYIASRMAAMLREDAEVLPGPRTAIPS
jgi:asparagine synthetase B (glutamine-hydrolysing)